MSVILVINPGSTSTKLALFKDGEVTGEHTIRHSPHELSKFASLYEQRAFRKALIIDFLESAGHPLTEIDAIIGRGGMLRPLESGTYTVNDDMIEDLRSAKYGEHASNLGAILAKELSLESGKETPAYIADPVVVDEMDPVAKLSGHPDFTRRSIFHALNQKAVTREVAARYGKKYEDMNFIVVHMGGGISIGAHKRGRVVDVNNALNGDGPFSPERAGTLPITGLIKLCYSGKYSKNEVKKLIKGNGGLMAYTGTSDCQKIQQAIVDGDKNAEMAYKAMAYQIVKWAGRMAAVLSGDVDSIIITGGIAHDSRFMVPWLTEKLSFIAPISVVPGGNEELSLAMACSRVLEGIEKTKQYRRAE
ncbi:MAG TPA: butyrate kinase [Mesotoga infera]|uniref:Probable butyrate kinase n=1 Tax=Mesotoga infera TaxID=1236046 RepID=A0A7C1CXE6_9BACT|nr:butyrate kinase [Mesotoga infera]